MMEREIFSWSVCYRTIFLLILMGIFPNYTPMESPVLKDVWVCIPNSHHLEIRWVVPPQTSHRASSILPYCFAVDQSGDPWLGLSPNFLCQPVKRYLLQSPERFLDIVHLHGKVPLVITPWSLGYLGSPDNYSAPSGSSSTIPQAFYQPIVTFPFVVTLVGKGDNRLFLVTSKKSEGKIELFHEIYTYPLGISSILPFSVSLSKVLQTYHRITAVSGTDQELLVAIGKTILEINLTKQSQRIYYKHPTENITQLYWVPNVGLFYTTNNEVGYIGKKGSCPILRSQVTYLSEKVFLIDVQGTTLFIYHIPTLGILALEGIQEYKNFQFVSDLPNNVPPLKVLHTVCVGKKDLHSLDSFTGPSFPRDQVRHIVWTTTFERSIDISRETTFPAISKLYFLPFAQQPILSLPSWIRFKPDEKQTTLTIPFSPSSPEKAIPESLSFTLSEPKNTQDDISNLSSTFIPGDYLLTCEIDGKIIAKLPFQISGPYTIREAILLKKDNEIEKLIQQGEIQKLSMEHFLDLIHLTTTTGSPHILEMLLKTNHSIDDRKHPFGTEHPLFQIILMESTELCSLDVAMQMAKILIRYGFQVNYITPNGLSPLMYAVLLKRNHWIPFLIREGANPNCIYQGIPLISYLIQQNVNEIYNEAIESILQHGGNPNLPDSEGHSPLFFAVTTPHPSVNLVRLLIRHHAKIHEVIQGQTSILYHAIQSTRGTKEERVKIQYREIVNQLIRAGAQLRHPEETPLLISSDVYPWIDSSYLYTMLVENKELRTQALRWYKDPKMNDLLYKIYRGEFYQELTRVVNRQIPIQQVETTLSNLCNQIVWIINLRENSYRGETITCPSEWDPQEKCYRMGLAYNLRINRITNQGEGAYVSDVKPSSPASKSGIKVGDIIIAINHHPVTHVDTIVNHLIKDQPSSYTLTLLRPVYTESPSESSHILAAQLFKLLNNQTMATFYLKQYLGIAPQAQLDPLVMQLMQELRVDPQFSPSK